MSRLVQLVGSGIGLAVEATTARQSQSRTPSPANASRSRQGRDNTKSSAEHDGYSSADWRSSEKNRVVDDGPEWNNVDAWSDDSKTDRSLGDPTEPYSANGPRISYPLIQRGLPLPVILPQRRPENKSRGFMLAYAPALNDCGIDEATFLDFLEAFNKAVKASPVFDVINVAAFAAGFAPSATAQVVSLAVNVAVTVAKSAQEKKQTNAFLDKLNKNLFEPHGLFCLIMTYKPNQTSSIVGVNSNETPVNLAADRNTESSRTTRGEWELPEACPLEFPPDSGSPKKFGNFVGEYYDKRAQAKFTAQNSDSSLNVAPAPQFISRYSDPNHPANNGSIISLATGGLLDPKQRRMDRKTARAEKRGRHTLTASVRGGISGTQGSAAAPADQGGIIRRTKKRAMNQDVLYLMIVNMPTGAEMNAISSRPVSPHSTHHTPSPRQEQQHLVPSTETRSSWEQTSEYSMPPAYQQSQQALPPLQTQPALTPVAAPYSPPPQYSYPLQGYPTIYREK